MKIIPLFILLSCVGCQPITIQYSAQSAQDSTANWQVNIQKPVFTAQPEKTAQKLDKLNERIDFLVDSLQLSLRTEADQFFTTYGQDTLGRPAFSYELFVTDTVFLATEKEISLQLVVYTFSGGAHGMTDFYSLNYDVEKQQLRSAKQLVDYSQAEAIDALLKKYFKNPNDCFSEIPTLALATGVNMSADSVIFTYAHYVLGAYYCGYLRVEVPKEEMGAYLLK